MAHVREEGGLSLVRCFCSILGNLEFMRSLCHLRFEPRCLQAQILNARSVNYPDCPGGKKEHNAPKPPCRPPWRQNRNGERNASRVPNAVVVRALYSEYVRPRGKVRVRDATPPAVYLVPKRLQSFQPVTVSVLLRSYVTECGEFDVKMLWRGVSVTALVAQMELLRGEPLPWRTGSLKRRKSVNTTGGA